MRAADYPAITGGWRRARPCTTIASHRAKGVAMRELTDNERAEIERDAVLPQLDARELVDEEYLERAIKEMYTEVAENPGGEFHFLTGRAARGRSRGPPRAPAR